MLSPEGDRLALKLHRLGRTSFRAVQAKRDYLRHRTSFRPDPIEYMAQSMPGADLPVCALQGTRNYLSAIFLKELRAAMAEMLSADMATGQVKHQASHNYATGDTSCLAWSMQ